MSKTPLLDKWRGGPSTGAPIYAIAEELRQAGYQSLGWANGWTPNFKPSWTGKSNSIWNHDDCLSLYFSDEAREFYLVDSGD